MKSLLTSQIKECSRCVLSTADVTDITFDDHGVCNYCKHYDDIFNHYKLSTEEKRRQLEKLKADIKKTSKDKKYDCIIGLSGGIDSVYACYYAKKVLGLNPLAVHFDAGWNSQVAVANIQSALSSLDMDLHTEVVDWKEIKDLQLSFLKASVVDIELVNDFGISATLYNVAYQYGIKYVLHGGNIQTEGGKLPTGWTWSKYDEKNILGIHKIFGKVKLKTYPSLSYGRLKYLKYVYGIKLVGILNYCDYDKENVKKQMKKEVAWKDYGNKHFESVFTRFYQAYILPTKFGIKKQKFHLSVLICSGQLSREQAIAELNKEYYSEEQAKSDKEYCIKKLEISEKEFNDLMALPIKRHDDYPTYTNTNYKYEHEVISFLLPSGRLVKKLFKIFK